MTNLERFKYDPTTGDLIWRERDRCHFKSDWAHLVFKTRFANKVAGCIHYTKAGRPACKSVYINGRHEMAHRVIWEMHNGPIPKGMVIDHINGGATDNRLANLRISTHAQNSQNKRRSSTNTTGVKGVFYRAKDKRYVAVVYANGKYVFSKRFVDIESAKAACREAATKYHGEFARFE